MKQSCTVHEETKTQSLHSLGGMPPLTGFVPKFVVISSMMYINIPVTMMMIMSTIFSLYFYFSIMLSGALSLNKMNINPNMNSMGISIMSILSVMAITMIM